MPNAPSSNFNEVDQSFFVDSLVKGIGAVMLQTVRGKYGLGDDIITSWTQFVRIYGGEKVGYDGATLVKRALARGAQLRINKIGHYTTISDATSLDAVKATYSDTPNPFAVDGADEVFDLVTKNAGADMNNVTIVISNASNGDTDSFNLAFNHAVEPELNELYSNIKVVGKPALVDCHFLDEVIQKSKFFNVTYKNLAAAAGAAPIRPTNGTWALTGGTNGSAVVDADYAGDSAGKTGFYAFDNQNDFEAIASLDRFTNNVHVAGAAYAANRMDHIYIASIPFSNVSATSINTFRATTLIDSRFTYFVTGGVKIQNPFLQNQSGDTPYNINESGDVMGILCSSSAQFGPWWVFSEQQRGQLQNALGVVNNFGANYADLNLLANRQVNAVVNLGGRIYLTGNASGQLASSRKSFINVVKLIIYMKKTLKPTVDRYLGQPMDFRSFKELADEVTPFLDSLTSAEKRALSDYQWRGDQYANTDADLTINNRNDMDAGKYKVQLWMKEIVGINEITINMISAPSGTEFDVNVN